MFYLFFFDQSHDWLICICRLFKEQNFSFIDPLYYIFVLYNVGVVLFSLSPFQLVA